MRFLDQMKFFDMDEVLIALTTRKNKTTNQLHQEEIEEQGDHNRTG